MPRKKTHAHRVYQFLGKPGPGTFVAGHVRYSSEMQDPVSIVTQKRRIEEFAQKKGWIIVRWYEEPERRWRCMAMRYQTLRQRNASGCGTRWWGSDAGLSCKQPCSSTPTRLTYWWQKSARIERS